MAYIKAKGVGAKDKKEGASLNSYMGYLRSVTKILMINISPDIVKNDDDIANILARLKDTRTDHTIDNYGTALRRYAEMVQELEL